MFCGRKECSGCKFFKRDGCVTVPECAYKDLKDKLEKAKEALLFYGEKREYQTWIGVERNKERRGRIWKDNGKIARKALKDIEK